MPLNPIARGTARRNVAERIDRLLNGLQRAQRPPTRRELFWLRQALVNLQEGQSPAGEDAMDKAERVLPIPEHAANDLSTNAGVTVEQLRMQLDQIMKALSARRANRQRLSVPASVPRESRTATVCR